MKTLKIISLIVIGLVIVLALVISGTDTPQNTTPQNIDWSTASYEDKQAHIEAYLKNSDQAATTVMVEAERRIKSNFNYPESVDFSLGNYPVISRGRVVEADSGLVFVDGIGTAKNAFGAKESFNYTVKLQITDKEVNLLEVNVTN